MTTEDIPPFMEYIITSNNKGIASLLKEAQVKEVLGEHASAITSLVPVMVMTRPAVGGVERMPLYSWVEVKDLAINLGIDVACVPAYTNLLD
tara:strand:+ start:84 stop:359 length:276 start_codon:yes stop_codon:yes gene_type:complete